MTDPVVIQVVVPARVTIVVVISGNIIVSPSLDMSQENNSQYQIMGWI